MPNRPRVSVIIPTYNRVHLVGDAIDSVLKQSFSEYEIIVVDDGSSDGTEAFIRERFPAVSFIRKPNGGAASARNVGIQASRGELVAFLDSDDMWLPEKLALQVARMDRDPDLGMVSSNYFHLDESGARRQFTRRESFLEGNVARNIFLYSSIATPTVMVRRSVLEEVGLFEEGLEVAEDDNLWIRIAYHSRIDILKEHLVLIRSFSHGLSGTGRLLEGVKAHIGLLKSRFPEVYDHLGFWAIRSKLCTVYRLEGHGHFASERLPEARRFFLRSFLFSPRFITARYLLATFLPLSFIRWIRRKKQERRALSSR